MRKKSSRITKPKIPAYTKYKFTTIERYAVWEAHGNKCFWCLEPLSFSQVTVDHVFPESLLPTPDKIQSIITNYKLPSNFNINGFENWVPLHSGCNSRKHEKVFIDSPALIRICHEIIAKAPHARTIAANLAKEIAADKTIAKLLTDLEKGKITKYGIAKRLNLETHQIDQLKFESLPQVQHLKPGWRIVEKDIKKGTLYVTNGEYTFITGITPSVEWQCPFCHEYGPWDAAKCMSCGRLDFPDY